MTAVEGLRRSGLSRIGLLSLIVLGYLVYVAGVLLENRDHIVTDFPVIEVVGATGLLILGLVFVRWFFITEPGVPSDEAEDEATA